MKLATKYIHAGTEPDPSTGAIMTPIYQTSTYVQESPGKNKGYGYARGKNPTREARLASTSLSPFETLGVSRLRYLSKKDRVKKGRSGNRYGRNLNMACPYQNDILSSHCKRDSRSQDYTQYIILCIRLQARASLAGVLSAACAGGCRSAS